MNKVEQSVLIDASPELVWELLTTQEGMRQWFEKDMEIEMRIGGKHRHFDEETNQWITGEVLEIEPMNKISLSWYEDDPDWVNPIRFTFLLEKASEGTRVKFIIDGFEQIGTSTWDKTFKAYERGAERHHLLTNLKEVAESNNVNT